ncbi:MAG: hypothetical protein Q9223_002224 [Gallowayella weberi]
MAGISSVDSNEVAPGLSTEPGPQHSYKLCLDITGANQGVGLGIAEVCLANSAAVVYSLDINEPGHDFETLRQLHNNLKFFNTDVTIKENVEKAIEEIYDTEGRLDGFVANAGMTKHQPALNFNEEQLAQMFQLNAPSSSPPQWHPTGQTEYVPNQIHKSHLPKDPQAAPSAPYSGTKAAIRNMAHTLAMEWAPHGIRVNSVSPGFVRTQMTTYMEGSPDWDLKMKYYGGMPRLAKPQEIGGAYVYLMSDAASYTTGIDIPVAGIVGAW